MFHHRLSALLAAFSIMAGGSASAQQQTISIPLGDLLGVLKTIEVGVYDQVATMILDTGGGVTVVTPELADRMGCQPWGQLSGFRLSGERLSMTRCSAAALRIGDKHLATQEVGVFDLAALLPPEAPRIDGILSLDALSSTPFTLELDAGRLTLETPESLAARTSDAFEIPIRLHRQAGGASLTVMARLPTDHGPLWMQLDAGSDAPLQIPPSSAAALGLDPDTTRQPATLFLEGVDGAKLPVTTNARVRDMIIDGNIALPVMRTWVMTFDLSRNRLWVRPVSR